MGMKTWRDMITGAMSHVGESWDDVESVALESSLEDWDEDYGKVEPSLDTPFDTGYGGTRGCYFTVWTANRIYFPACYDGAEWVASVARNPNGKATPHVGGG